MASRELPLRIAGVGRYLPERIVDNREIEVLCGLRAGALERTEAGVETRRWVAPGETNASMAAIAVREAVSDAGLELTDIDLILNASGTQEQAIPDGAPFIQRELGLGESGIPAFSVHATCLGFVQALEVAAGFLASSRYRRIVIVNADIASIGIDFDEPESAMLFGDAATAVVVTEPDEDDDGVPESCIELSHYVTYGVAAELTEIRGGGTKCHPNHPDTVPKDNLFHMNSGRIFMQGTKRFMRFVRHLDQEAGESVLATADRIVPHQPSMKAIRVLERYGVDADKIVVTLDKYGNCVSASMPSALYEGIRDGRIERGNRLLLIGTGAGLSIGALMLRY